MGALTRCILLWPTSFRSEWLVVTPVLLQEPHCRRPVLLSQVLITIDVLVDSNEALKDAWNKYTTLRQMIASSQSRFGESVALVPSRCVTAETHWDGLTEVSEAEMQALTENIAQLEPRLSPFGFFRVRRRQWHY